MVRNVHHQQETYKNKTAHHVHGGTKGAEKDDLVGGDHPLATGLVTCQLCLPLLAPLKLLLRSHCCCLGVRFPSISTPVTPSSFQLILPTPHVERTFSQVLRPSCFWNSRWYAGTLFSRKTQLLAVSADYDCGGSGAAAELQFVRERVAQLRKGRTLPL